MRGKLTIILILLFNGAALQAQHQFDQWCFGDNAGLDFTKGKPVAFKSALNAEEGCSSIADAETGKLLFYTDGRTVYNANHEMMTNGNELPADASSTQAALIVKSPGNNKLFYIFTCSPDLRYSIVDMSMERGLGAVTTKNAFLASGVTEKLTAGSHGNGKDVWVITHNSGDNQFLSFLVTSNGVSPDPVYSYGGNSDGLSYSIGQIAMNMQDTQLVMTAYTPALDLFGFNNMTGKLTFRYTLDAAKNTYGVGFSPNGRFLYTFRQVVDGGGGFDIYQYDLKAGDKSAIIESKYVVTHGTFCYGAFQLGPDGKLYTPDSNHGSLSVINNPDLQGEHCNFSQSAIRLSEGTTATLGLPQAFWPKPAKILMPLPPPY